MKKTTPDTPKERCAKLATQFCVSNDIINLAFSLNLEEYATLQELVNIGTETQPLGQVEICTGKVDRIFIRLIGKGLVDLIRYGETQGEEWTIAINTRGYRAYQLASKVLGHD